MNSLPINLKSSLYHPIVKIFQDGLCQSINQFQNHARGSLNQSSPWLKLRIKILAAVTFADIQKTLLLI